MIKQPEFHNILRAVAHSASVGDIRENLNSVLFEFLGDEVRLVSTDGHRVTIAVLSIPEIGTGRFLAPIEDIKELLNIFKSKPDKRISFTVSDNLLIVTNGKASLNVDRLDLDYPDYRQILPADDTVLAGAACFNLDYLARMATACKSLMDRAFGVDIITRGAEGLITLRPALSESLEVLKSLEVHIMPIRREAC